MTMITVDPVTNRCSRCHQRGSLCICDGVQCPSTHGGDRCQLRPHAGTRHEAKHGAHVWIAETPNRRCDCCDGGLDGLGMYHFANVDALRAFLAEPDHERGAECDIADIPGWPYGLTFVTTGEAEAWLEEFDAAEAYDAAVEREWERRAEAAGVKL